MDVFTKCNKKWLLSVGKPLFDELDVEPDTYFKDIASGLHKFDALAIQLCCATHDIHAMVLLNRNYWTTRCANEYSLTQIKLAYIGQGNFKFIVPLNDQLIPPKTEAEPLKMGEVDASQLDASESDEAKLMDAGLLPDQDTSQLPFARYSDVGEASVHEPESSSSSQPSHMDDSCENDFDDEDIDMDTKTKKKPGEQDIVMDTNTNDNVSLDTEQMMKKNSLFMQTKDMCLMTVMFC